MRYLADKYPIHTVYGSPIQLDEFTYKAKKEKYEYCSIFTGRIEKSGLAVIQNTWTILNISEKPSTRFIMDPNAVYRVLEQTDVMKVIPYDHYIGIIHSHPDGPPGPSPIDRVMVKEILHGVYAVFDVKSNTIYWKYWDGKQFKSIRYEFY